MNFVRRRKVNNDPPVIITDLNGEIIHMNSSAQTNLKPLRVGKNISSILELDYVRKISMLDNRIDVTSPKDDRYNKAVVKVMGAGATKTIEITLLNYTNISESDEINDKKLLSTYSEIVENNIKSAIKLNNFIESTVDCLKSDLRFAYRNFEIVKNSYDQELYTYFSHLSTIAVGTVVILNEIEYRKPIKISVDNVFGEYVLNISVEAVTFQESEGLYNFCELFPKLSMRSTYVASLCDNDGIKYRFSVKPSNINISFVITEMINETGKFSCTPFGLEEGSFVAYILGLFSYKNVSDTTEEEQE